jgi:hypothetical protein
VNERRIVILLVASLGLSALNLGATLYFQFGRTSAAPAAAEQTATARVSDQEAIDLTRGIVDLYNAGKDHELYLRFDALARAEYSEPMMTAQMQKLRELFGQIEGFEYKDSDVVRNDADAAYIALSYTTQTSKKTFNSSTLRIVALRKDGHFGLFNFEIKAEAHEPVGSRGVGRPQTRAAAYLISQKQYANTPSLLPPRLRSNASS